MSKRIYIIGAGAIGKVLAVFLQKEGREVMILNARNDHGTETSHKLSVQLNDGSILKETILISSFSKQPVLDGVIVMANKSIGNESVAELLQSRCGDSPIVVMQNGLDIERAVLEKGFRNIYRCVLLATSQYVAEETLRFKPVASSPIGVIRGSASLLEEVITTLDTPLFGFAKAENIQPVIWKKVIANCVFNSVCPLLETDNGVFWRSERARQIAEDIIHECTGVARSAGVELNDEEVLQTVLQISKASDGQIISTLQDIRMRRPTEIETLNMAVVRSALRNGYSGSIERTKVLGELTKLKSEMNMDNAFDRS
jgi:2-dehydropantoate 2-reductase